MQSREPLGLLFLVFYAPVAVGIFVGHSHGYLRGVLFACLSQIVFVFVIMNITCAVLEELRGKKSGGSIGPEE